MVHCSNAFSKPFSCRRFLKPSRTRRLILGLKAPRGLPAPAHLECALVGSTVEKTGGVAARGCRSRFWPAPSFVDTILS
jgi:hypothetical protein